MSSKPQYLGVEAYLEIGFVKNQTLHSEKNKGERGVYRKGLHLETQGSESTEFLVAHRLGVLMRQM